MIWWSASRKICTVGFWAQTSKNKLMESRCFRRYVFHSFFIIFSKLKLTMWAHSSNWIIQALPSIAKEIIEVLDILLKWFVLRFCESNTSCLLKVNLFLFIYLLKFGWFSYVVNLRVYIYFLKYGYRFWNSSRSYLRHWKMKTTAWMKLKLPSFFLVWLRRLILNLDVLKLYRCIMYCVLHRKLMY